MPGSARANDLEFAGISFGHVDGGFSAFTAGKEEKCLVEALRENGRLTRSNDKCRDHAVEVIESACVGGDG